MTIEPITNLRNKTFVIPRYQRGYRWEVEQITMLLDDLKEFSEKSSCKKDVFYCLQPIVVVPIDEQKGIYEVVDGQQRLTTLWLIFNAIPEKFGGQNYYTLKFEGRPKQQEFIDDGHYSSPDETESLNNIDNFYLWRAYKTISDWMNKDGMREYDIAKVLQIKEHRADSPYVAVIWQEVSDQDSMTSFRNLNYGKIPLTATEIIKALLIQKDCYKEGSPEQGYAGQRATGWEQLSFELADQQLKGMIGDGDVDLMDVVVDAVADDINAEQQYQYERKDSNRYSADLFSYYVVNTYLDKAENRSDAAIMVWDKIRDRANRISNWFAHRNWYHLIGLYSLLSKKKGKDLIKEIEGIEKKVFDKIAFAENLRKKIGGALLVPEAIDNDGRPYPKEKQGLDSPNLRYGIDDEKLRKILTAYNVYITEASNDTEARFPFRLFREYNPTSLEHIHPKSVQGGSFKEYKNWFEVQKGNMTPENRTELEEMLKTESAFKDNMEDVNKRVVEIDSRIAGDITPDEIHHIKNLAIVDKDSNAAMQFFTLDVKRNILLEREKAGKTFVPPATHDVFSKRYSADSPGDMRYWMKNDREVYLQELKKMYDYYTV